MRDIFVIGSLNMDMVIRTPHLPLPGETILGTLIADIPGGKGANQAYAAGKLGRSTAMLGMVGRDSFGDALLHNLESVGVDTCLVARSEKQTGQAVIYVGEEQGNNSIVVLPGANHSCDAAFIRAHEAEIAQSRVVILQMEIPPEAIHEAIRLAHKHQCTVILNPAPAAGPLPDDLLPLIDYLAPNETELALLTGMSVNNESEAEAAAGKLVQSGVKNVLTTLGSKGALLVNGEGVRFYPSFTMKAVDTTAAGDTFIGAFAVRYSEGATISDAVLFANAAAAISVTRPGAQPSIPSRKETEAFLQEHQ